METDYKFAEGIRKLICDMHTDSMGEMDELLMTMLLLQAEQIVDRIRVYQYKAANHDGHCSWLGAK